MKKIPILKVHLHPIKAPSWRHCNIIERTFRLCTVNSKISLVSGSILDSSDRRIRWKDAGTHNAQHEHTWFRHIQRSEQCASWKNFDLSYGLIELDEP